MTQIQRPAISEYKDPVDFVRDMIHFRKEVDPKFSVHAATKSIRKISPTLVTLILKKKRKLTLDRVDDFARLLDLNSAEKIYFKNWIGQQDQRLRAAHVAPTQGPSSHERKAVAMSLLNDWLNVYVKDCFQLKSVQKDPSLLQKILLPIASSKRIQKAIQFLLREGYLRRTLQGETVLDTPLAVADPKVPSVQIRKFHKAALSLAHQAIDLYPPNERFANTLIIPLTEERHLELRHLVQEFAEKIQDFAVAQESGSGDRLYQVVINLSPIGGKSE